MSHFSLQYLDIYRFSCIISVLRDNGIMLNSTDSGHLIYFTYFVKKGLINYEMSHIKTIFFNGMN